MTTLPKNKSEETKIPRALLWALLCVVILGVLIFMKANWAGHGRAPAAIPGTGALSRDGDGASIPGQNVTIDLGKFFNADRQINWLGGGVALRGLSDLPSGRTLLQDVPFQIGGVVQLCGVGVRADSSKFPNSIEGIPVQRKCSRLHFLHATGSNHAGRVPNCRLYCPFCGWHPPGDSHHFWQRHARLALQRQ